jgi:uncharacterized membrane protein YjjP (DUF1212 family)
MSLGTRSSLLLAIARVFYVNGQTTDETLAAVKRISCALRLRTTMVPRWGELDLEAEDQDERLVSVVAASPTGIHMIRVQSIARTVEEIESRRLDPASAMEEVAEIAQAPPLPTWLFALAAAVGAVSLAMIFGVRHPSAGALIFLSAGAGGFLRRLLARHSTNLYVQPFVASLLAGLIGGLAVHWGESSPLRLVALCPCLVLVPGPHLLNGALDLLQSRIQIGAARLLYAGLVLAATATGLLLGLALVGQTLTVAPLGRVVPLWQDLVFAGVAAACYGIFYSMPVRMLVWPAATGAAAHALRWVVLSQFHFSFAMGVLIASIFVGFVITPVARRRHLPFAAIGFASVVSMLPGSYIFRMAGGLVRITDGSPPTVHLITGTIADGAMALLVTLAMGIGLLGPKLLLDGFAQKSRWSRPDPASFSLYG